MTATKSQAKTTNAKRQTGQLDRWDRLAERALADLRRGRRAGWVAPSRVELALNCFRYALREWREGAS